MNFLEVLDKVYDVDRKDNRIPSENKEYRCYEEIKPLDYECEIRFECLKINSKTKILICFGSSKIYFSDLDLLNIILKMGNEEVRWFINNFINVYKSKGILFRFMIKDKHFEGKGIPYRENNIILDLHTDNQMTINDLIFIINLILTKDYLGTEQLKESKEKRDLLKTTLCKYIILLEFYGLKNVKVKEVLREAEYPIEKEIYEVFTSYQELKLINKIFENNEMFENKMII